MPADGWQRLAPVGVTHASVPDACHALSSLRLARARASRGVRGFTLIDMISSWRLLPPSGGWRFRRPQHDRRNRATADARQVERELQTARMKAVLESPDARPLQLPDGRSVPRRRTDWHAHAPASDDAGARRPLRRRATRTPTRRTSGRRPNNDGPVKALSAGRSRRSRPWSSGRMAPPIRAGAGSRGGDSRHGVDHPVAAATVLERGKATPAAHPVNGLGKIALQ